MCHQTKEPIGNPLLLEEATELVHHGTTATLGGRGTAVLAATVGTTLGRLGRAGVAVLLDGIFGDATDDGSTDCSEESVVGLVAGEATSGSTGEGTGKTTLALLSLGTILTLVLFVSTVAC